MLVTRVSGPQGDSQYWGGSLDIHSFVHSLFYQFYRFPTQQIMYWALSSGKALCCTSPQIKHMISLAEWWGHWYSRGSDDESFMILLLLVLLVLLLLALMQRSDCAKYFLKCFTWIILFCPHSSLQWKTLPSWFTDEGTAAQRTLV